MMNKSFVQTVLYAGASITTKMLSIDRPYFPPGMAKEYVTNDTVFEAVIWKNKQMTSYRGNFVLILEGKIDTITMWLIF